MRSVRLYGNIMYVGGWEAGICHICVSHEVNQSPLWLHFVKGFLEPTHTHKAPLPDYIPYTSVSVFLHNFIYPKKTHSYISFHERESLRYI